MHSGSDGPSSALSSSANTNLALVTLFTAQGGHAVLAFNVRDRSGGGDSIDVWDNNHPNETHSIEVDGDGSWSYEPLGWEESPKGPEADDNLLTAYPLFAPHAFHYLRNASSLSLSAIADVPADTKVVESTQPTSAEPVVSPVITAVGDYAGASVLYDTDKGGITLEGDGPNATFRGSGILSTVERSAGSGALQAHFDAGVGSVGASGGSVTLAVTQWAALREHGCLGADGLLERPGHDRRRRIRSRDDQRTGGGRSGPRWRRSTHDPDDAGDDARRSDGANGIDGTGRRRCASSEEMQEEGEEGPLQVQQEEAKASSLSRFSNSSPCAGTGGWVR